MRSYIVIRDDEDASKWAVWHVDNESGRHERAIPGVRFDTEHRAELVAAALRSAFEAGWAEGRVLPAAT